MRNNKSRKFCFGWKSRLLAALLDGWHSLFKRDLPPPDQRPKRLLLSNWGSLGDVLLATSVIAPIKEHYPDCEIGFLVSEKGEKALSGISGIDRVHICKWQLSAKSTLGRLLQFMRFRRQTRTLVQEIALAGYDTFVELYPFFPNSITLGRAAHIPRRIGFDTSGGKPLLTDCVKWEKEGYLLNCYRWLLKPLAIDHHPSVPLALSDLPEHSPIILHTGSSNKEKELPITFWKELYRLLKKEGYSLAFTGAGERQKEMIAKIGATEAENQCDKLPWNDFVSWVARSPCVITIDSVSAHIAAAAGRPLIVFYLKKLNIGLWKPEKALAFEKVPDPQEVLREIKKHVVDRETVDLHSYR
jgi:ADP-heptose:LPS heptosyltransferase